MFNKLREKLKSWTKTIINKSEEAEEEIEEIEIKERKEKKRKTQPEILSEIEEKKSITELIKEEEKIPISRTDEIKEKVEEIEKKEEEEEESAPGKKGFFQKIISKIKKVRISEEDFKEYSNELELLLLENNVALTVAERIIIQLKQKVVGREILKKEIENEIKDALKETIEKMLAEPFDILLKIKEKKEFEKKPYVILFCGINGTGKTTTIAKFAYLLKKKGISCVMAAADTFRAASIEQIKQHGGKLGVEVISHEYGSDPASVGFDAIKNAEKNRIDCVLIDTAGRMHTAKNLMVQIEKIAKVCKPDLKIFVGESITGNDIVEQVTTFDEALKIDGIILAKADIDEKGGTALSIGYVTRKPILYLGTGQKYEDLELFDKRKFTEKLGL